MAQFTAWARGLVDAPERFFLLVAGLGGLILVALIPPLAGGNERYNFQRVAMIASFHPMIEPAMVPAGLVDLLETAHGQFPQGRQPPYSYGRADMAALAEIPLRADQPKLLEPNAIAVLNPVAYAPQVAVYWLGQAFGARPLVLFYLGRMAGLVFALAFTALAIRRMPLRPLGLTAIALLPMIEFSRVTLDADQATNALAFLFLAHVMSAILRKDAIAWREFAWLVGLGFFAAQCKSAYVVLLALALAIPPSRFGSRGAWTLGTAAIVIPGALATLLWMLSLKHGFFAGAHYHTYAGDVDPDGQTAAILAHPLDFLAIFARTLFLTPFFLTAAFGFLGAIGPPVYLPSLAYGALTLCLAVALYAEGAPEEMKPSAPARLLAVLVFAGGLSLILTLLYIQWTGLGGPIIEGFNGRYLYPLAPALLMLFPPRSAQFFGLRSQAWLALLGATSLIATLSVTYHTYWA